MIEIRGIAVTGIVVCFLEFICGITTAGLVGSAKSYAISYNNNPAENFGEIDFYYYGELVRPVNYTLFVGIIVAIVAFLRLLLHVYYLIARALPRVVAFADLAVVCMWFVFILAGVALLPSKLDLFGSYDGISAPYTDWVMKLKRAGVFVLLAFLLWLVTLVLAAFAVKKAASPASTTANGPVSNAGKNVQMGGTPNVTPNVTPAAYV